MADLVHTVPKSEDTGVVGALVVSASFEEVLIPSAGDLGPV